MDSAEDCLKVQKRQDRESIECYLAFRRESRTALGLFSTSREHPGHVQIVSYRLAYLHEEDCLDKGG